MSDQEKTQTISGAMVESMKIPCPKCFELMMLHASRCPHCQAEFSEEEVKANMASKKSDHKSCLIMLGVVVLLGAILYGLASSCSTKGSGEGAAAMSAAEEEFAWKEAAMQVVRERLRDPGSAEFSNLTVYPGTDDSATIICGYVNSRNGFGGLTGPQRFIAGGTVMLAEDFTAADMQTAWTAFCN